MEKDIPERSGGLRDKTASPEITLLASGANTHLPEFIRLPKPGKRCYWTGLTRSAMNELVLGESPKVASMVLTREGAGRGVRLVSLSALLGHLNGLMSQQGKGKEASDE